jgi:hypothetical protein
MGERSYSSIDARQMADRCVGLAMHLTLAEDSGTYVYADAARHDIESIKINLARIEAAVALMPKRVEAA